MKLFLILIIALFSSMSFAGITANQEFELNTLMGPVAHKDQLGTLVQKNQNQVVGKYSFAVQGGSSTAAIKLLTNLNDPKSYVRIPYNAIITHVYVNTLTIPRSSNPALATQPNITVDAVSIGDLVASRGASTTFYKILAGVPLQGTTTTYIKLSSDTSSGSSTGYIVTTSVNAGASSATSSNLTQGKFNVYITYSLGD